MLLKTNGIVVINEATAVQSFSTLTFGLTAGWWLYKDEDVRLPGSPLLSNSRWVQLLRDAGFRTPQVFGLQSAQADDSGQNVIVAESDGQTVSLRSGGSGITGSSEYRNANRYRQQSRKTVDVPELQSSSVEGSASREEIAGFITTLLSEVLRMDRDGIHPRTEFERYGVDSLVVMELNKQLESKFGKMEPTLLFDYPTVELLSQHLYSRQAASADDSASQTVQAIQQPAQIIQYAALPVQEDLVLYWKKLRESNSMPVIIETQPADQLIRSNGYGVVHALIDTPNAKRMEVVISGQGDETVVLIPGFGYTAPQWMHQLDAWSLERKVIVIHCPGFGLSEGNGNVSLSSIAKIYIEVFDSLGITGEVHVVGISWGGMIAQVLAAEYVQRIGTVTLVSSFAEAGQDDGTLKEKVEKDFKHIGKGTQYKEILNWEYSNPHALRYLDEYKEASPTTSQWLPRIVQPTLIVSGKEDQVVTPDASMLLHERIRGSEYIQLEGAGHALNYTHPQLFNEIWASFMLKNTYSLTNKAYR